MATADPKKKKKKRKKKESLEHWLLYTSDAADE